MDRIVFTLKVVCKIPLLILTDGYSQEHFTGGSILYVDPLHRSESSSNHRTRAHYIALRHPRDPGRDHSRGPTKAFSPLNGFGLFVFLLTLSEIDVHPIKIEHLEY